MSLKELKNLAPWTWDPQATKHPPKRAALQDFEKIETAWRHEDAMGTPLQTQRQKCRSVSGLNNSTDVGWETPSANGLARKAASADRARCLLKRKATEVLTPRAPQTHRASTTQQQQRPTREQNRDGAANPNVPTDPGGTAALVHAGDLPTVTVSPGCVTKNGAVCSESRLHKPQTESRIQTPEHRTATTLLELAFDAAPPGSRTPAPKVGDCSMRPPKWTPSTAAVMRGPEPSSATSSRPPVACVPNNGALSTDDDSIHSCAPGAVRSVQSYQPWSCTTLGAGRRPAALRCEWQAQDLLWVEAGIKHPVSQEPGVAAPTLVFSGTPSGGLGTVPCMAGGKFQRSSTPRAGPDNSMIGAPTAASMQPQPSPVRAAELCPEPGTMPIPNPLIANGFQENLMPHCNPCISAPVSTAALAPQLSVGDRTPYGYSSCDDCPWLSPAPQSLAFPRMRRLRKLTSSSTSHAPLPIHSPALASQQRLQQQSQHTSYCTEDSSSSHAAATLAGSGEGVENDGRGIDPKAGGRMSFQKLMPTTHERLVIQGAVAKGISSAQPRAPRNTAGSSPRNAPRASLELDGDRNGLCSGGPHALADSHDVDTENARNYSSMAKALFVEPGVSMATEPSESAQGMVAGLPHDAPEFLLEHRPASLRANDSAGGDGNDAADGVKPDGSWPQMNMQQAAPAPPSSAPLGTWWSPDALAICNRSSEAAGAIMGGRLQLVVREAGAAAVVGRRSDSGVLAPNRAAESRGGRGVVLPRIGVSSTTGISGSAGGWMAARQPKGSDAALNKSASLVAIDSQCATYAIRKETSEAAVRAGLGEDEAVGAIAATIKAQPLPSATADLLSGTARQLPTAQEAVTEMQVIAMATVSEVDEEVRPVKRRALVTAGRGNVAAENAVAACSAGVMAEVSLQQQQESVAEATDSQHLTEPLSSAPDEAAPQAASCVADVAQSLRAVDSCGDTATLPQSPQVPQPNGDMEMVPETLAPVAEASGCVATATAGWFGLFPPVTLTEQQLQVLRQLLSFFSARGCGHPSTMSAAELVAAISSFCKSAGIPSVASNIQILASWLGTLLALEKPVKAFAQAHALMRARPQQELQTSTDSPGKQQPPAQKQLEVQLTELHHHPSAHHPPSHHPSVDQEPIDAAACGLQTQQVSSCSEEVGDEVPCRLICSSPKGDAKLKSDFRETQGREESALPCGQQEELNSQAHWELRQQLPAQEQPQDNAPTGQFCPMGTPRWVAPQQYQGPSQPQPEAQTQHRCLQVHDAGITAPKTAATDELNDRGIAVVADLLPIWPLETRISRYPTPMEALAADWSTNLLPAVTALYDLVATCQQTLQDLLLTAAGTGPPTASALLQPPPGSASATLMVSLDVDSGVHARMPASGVSPTRAEAQSWARGSQSVLHPHSQTTVMQQQLQELLTCQHYTHGYQQRHSALCCGGPPAGCWPASVQPAWLPSTNTSLSYIQLQAGPEPQEALILRCKSSRPRTSSGSGGGTAFRLQDPRPGVRMRSQTEPATFAAPSAPLQAARNPSSTTAGSASLRSRLFAYPQPHLGPSIQMQSDTTPTPTYMAATRGVRPTMPTSVWSNNQGGGQDHYTVLSGMMRAAAAAVPAPAAGPPPVRPAKTRSQVQLPPAVGGPPVVGAAAVSHAPTASQPQRNDKGVGGKDPWAAQSPLAPYGAAAAAITSQAQQPSTQATASAYSYHPAYDIAAARALCPPQLVKGPTAPSPYNPLTHGTGVADDGNVLQPSPIQSSLATGHNMLYSHSLRQYGYPSATAGHTWHYGTLYGWCPPYCSAGTTVTDAYPYNARAPPPAGSYIRQTTGPFSGGSAQVPSGAATDHAASAVATPYSTGAVGLESVAHLHQYPYRHLGPMVAAKPGIRRPKTLGLGAAWAPMPGYGQPANSNQHLPYGSSVPPGGHSGGHQGAAGWGSAG